MKRVGTSDLDHNPAKYVKTHNDGSANPDTDTTNQVTNPDTDTYQNNIFDYPICTDIVIEILKKISFKDIYSMRIVNISMHNITKNPTIWIYFHNKLLGNPSTIKFMDKTIVEHHLLHELYTIEDMNRGDKMSYAIKMHYFSLFKTICKDDTIFDPELMEKAIFHGNTDVVEFLIQKKYPINSIHKNPLIYSIDRNQLSYVKLLVNNGADVNILVNNSDINMSVKKVTPLLKAVYNGNLEIVKYLYTLGANIENLGLNNGMLLYCAVYENKLDCVKYLCSVGIDIDTIYKGYTSLTVATHMGNIDILKHLHTLGANIEGGPNRMSALYIAAQENKLDCVEYLCTVGANINYTFNGITPLHIAVKNGNIDIARYLILHGSQINGLNPHTTPLFDACVEGKFECAELLIENGADVNIVCGGKTALYALYTTYDLRYISTYTGPRLTRLTNLMLDNGANPMIKCDNKCCILAACKTRNLIDVIELIKKSKFEIPPETYTQAYKWAIKSNNNVFKRYFEMKINKIKQVGNTQ